LLHWPHLFLKIAIEMILTTKGRYAINAILEMSENSDGQPISLSVISKRQNISVSYLEQIFSNLKNVGLVKSVKGPGGGYLLEKDKKITAHDVIIATGEKIKMTSCANENNCVKINENNHKCKTHHVWKGLEKVIADYFGSIVISDIGKEERR
jgi:Rrf2 family iron-sulfur cluster assembly transcriptional regulator